MNIPQFACSIYCIRRKFHVIPLARVPKCLKNTDKRKKETNWISLNFIQKVLFDFGIVFPFSLRKEDLYHYMLFLAFFWLFTLSFFVLFCFTLRLLLFFFALFRFVFCFVLFFYNGVQQFLATVCSEVFDEFISILARREENTRAFSYLLVVYGKAYCRARCI